MKQTNLLKGLLIIVVLLCSTQVWAYDFEVDNIQYTVTSLDELTAEVSGLSDTSATEVVIPKTVEYKGRTLTVTSIGSKAFYKCSGLTGELTIPNSVTSIGDYAFYWCSGLKAVIIGKSVTSIGDYAFYNCSGLTGELAIPGSVTTIGDSAFELCSGLTGELAIPGSVTTIGDSAFELCSGLTEITIPEGVTEIGKYTFWFCSGLTAITIPESVTTIGDNAFSGCSGLPEITIPEGVTTIGDNAFYRCTELTVVNFNAMACTSAGSSSYPVFEACSNLSTVNFGDNVTRIPDYLLYGCSGLSGTLTIPNSVTQIGEYAFYNCSSLKALDISNNVTSLGNYSIHGCSALESLEIGQGIEYLLDYYTSELSFSYASFSYVSDYYYYPCLWEDAPSKMGSIILKDCLSNFYVRGYGDSYGSTKGSIYRTSGSPLFSNIEIGYFYVGRPLYDIESWTYTGSYYLSSSNTNKTTLSISYSMSISQPYGVIQTLEIGGHCYDVPYFYQSVEYLILDENVDTYTATNIYQGNLKGIICKSSLPPVLSGTFDNSNYVNTIVYVPIGSKATYEATDGWKTFWDIQELDMQSIPPGYTDAVQSITAYGKADEIGYYTIDGKKVSTPQRGINIIRYSDGTARKVLMR